MAKESQTRREAEAIKKTLSTGDRNSKFYFIVAIVGIIILLVSLNKVQESFKNYSIPNINIPIISTFNYGPDMELQDPTRLNQSKELETKKEEVECDIFDGKWIYDPERSPLYVATQCPFLGEQVSCQMNGRPDSEYEKWSWQGKRCHIPRFNGTDMLERLKGKRVIIVGDSLNRNQWESLACLLYSAIPSSRAHVDSAGGAYKVFKAKDYNCTVEFHWSPFLVELEVKSNGSRILHLDKISSSSQQWRGADVMLFNTGHWWLHTGKFKAWDMLQYEGKLFDEMEIESKFTKAIMTWSHWIDSNTDAAKTMVFFRNVSPEHKRKQSCHNATQPNLNESSFAYKFPKQITDAVERTIQGMKTPVKYLNVTRLSEYRRDAHPSLYATKEEQKSYPDCSHWCLPGLPDTWNSLMYASLIVDS